MPARASWKGFLRINQLSVPVKAFTAAASGPEISLNQLHRDCGQRLRQQKLCPVHGAVMAEEIISGFEYAQDQFLPIEPAELEALRPEDRKEIAVDCFVPCDRFDAVYHSGRTYYLVPDGPPGQRPFSVFREGMRQSLKHAVALVVIGHTEFLVELRPMAKVIAMTVLEYPQRIRPAEDYETEVSSIEPTVTEQQLIGQLIDALTDNNLVLERFRDQYTEKLAELIQRRLTAHQQKPQIMSHGTDETDLVAALMASLGMTRATDIHAETVVNTTCTESNNRAAAEPLRRSG